MSLDPIPSEGDPRFDAIVDALIGCFHYDEVHAFRVASVVLQTLETANA